jgi:hypothetical protein
MVRLRLFERSEYLRRGVKAGDENHYEQNQDNPEPPLDEDARLLAPEIEERRQEIRAHAADDDRKHDEPEQIIAGEARSDGDDLVGNRRRALDQDDLVAPLCVGGAEGFQLVAIAVEPDEKLAERVVEQRADGVAQKPAEHGRRPVLLRRIQHAKDPPHCGGGFIYQFPFEVSGRFPSPSRERALLVGCSR